MVIYTHSIIIHPVFILLITLIHAIINDRIMYLIQYYILI
jgi:hypothetical protein